MLAHAMEAWMPWQGFVMATHARTDSRGQAWAGKRTQGLKHCVHGAHDQLLAVAAELAHWRWCAAVCKAGRLRSAGRSDAASCASDASVS